MFLGEELQLDGLAYASGAGLNTTKKCLDGTRTEILAEIVDWINNPKPNAPRVFWLFGQAGIGKSAIAHTIAMQFKDLGRLGSCFCFARDRQADRRHEKIFTTIARDLASRDLRFRATLATVIASDHSLKSTPDVTQQWRKLIVDPILNISDFALGNVVIVIDALDESGGEATREHILNVLASPEAAELPSNIRILVTSRPLPDIEITLSGFQHVKHRPMETIPLESTERDIRLYVSQKLRGPNDDFTDTDFELLAKRSDGLFEWARLACEFIKRHKAGATSKERFEDLVSPAPGAGMALLDKMYRVILEDIMDETPRALSRFHSIMQQVLWTVEPLSMRSLSLMRRGFPDQTERYGVEVILRSMASLFSGITDQNTPVRPLHSSFYDFLMDKARSERFHVDPSNVHANLAFASLHVMRAGLRFNICQLQSSYSRNSEIADLDKRVEANITDHLSYSCRYWNSHVAETKFNARLATEVEAFLNKEQVLYWLETLSLLNALNGAPSALRVILNWIDDNSGYEDAVMVARDSIKLVRRFGGAIAQSTPHLYLSALPFSPTNSTFATRFSEKFSKLPKLAKGRDEDWPIVQITAEGHTSYVWCVVFSPDGQKIASCADDETIRIWDAETGLQIGEALDGHTDTVLSVAFSPNGKLITSSSDDCTIRLWDTETGSERWSTGDVHSKSVTAVTYSPDGTLIASGSHDNTVRLWDVETGGQVGKPYEGHTDGIHAVAFSPDGKRIVSGSMDQTIRIWEVTAGSAVRTLQGHAGDVYSVAFSPDGKWIASGSSDTTICIWDAETYVKLGEPLDNHTDEVKSIAFSPDNKRLVSGSDDNTICLWDVETGQQIGDPLTGHTETVTSVVFSPDGKRIASGSDDYTIRVWDAEPKVQVRHSMEDHSGFYLPVAISPDGTQIASSLGDDTMFLWDTKTGAQIDGPFEGHTGSIFTIAFSPNGNRIASGSDDCSVRLWDAKTGTQIGEPLQGHSDEISCVTFSPDGTRLASGSLDCNIHIWDVATGQKIGLPFKGHTESACWVAFSPDGMQLVSGSHDTTIRLWDVETGSQIGSTLEGHDGWVCSVAFSPDGKKIASGSDDTDVRLWDVDTQSLLLDPLEGHTHWIQTVAFSPDGKWVISGSDDHTIRIWDAETGSPIGSPLLGHTGAVHCVAFFPDGKQIASTSNDGTIRVWDMVNSAICEPADTISSLPEVDNPPDDHRAVTQYPGLFSFVPEHALRDVHKLFHDINDMEGDWRDLIQLKSDGWIVGPRDRLLIWVPLTYRSSLRFMRNTLVIPRSEVELDLSSMVHGNAWEECFSG